MESITLKDRCWGSLAHVPIITIIWSCYLLYRYWYGPGIHGSIFDFHVINVKSLPITPIIFTLLSIPISVSIKRLNQQVIFVRENAQEAYLFSVWLLKIYIVCFALALLGMYFSYEILVKISEGVGLFLTIFCFVQAIMGIYTATHGNVYHYWYPRKKP
jgi:hypothetical protein